MKTDFLRYIFLLTIFIPVVWTISCSGSGKSSDKKSQPVAIISDEPSAKLIRMVSPEENAEFKLNDNIRVLLAPEGKNTDPDSIKIWFDGQEAGVLKNSSWEYTIPSLFTKKTGRKSLKVIAYKTGNKTQTITRFIIICSDVIPVRNSYRVINTYPHDREAFTQGLAYENGMLYEGTGQETGSSLRKVELETGKILRQLNLEPQLFGEGITVFGDKIYQVTWQNKVGFVYDKATFNVINKVNYQTEGWGLTTAGNRIVMSDGSNILYFMDPEFFTIVSKLEIYDTEKKVDQLNELEYINGEIWANIWQTDLIARIDPESGKVIAYIDLKGILPESERDQLTDVLNGIASDPETNRIFVTGKRWPKLFEIRLIE